MWWRELQFKAKLESSSSYYSLLLSPDPFNVGFNWVNYVHRPTMMDPHILFFPPSAIISAIPEFRAWQKMLSMSFNAFSTQVSRVIEVFVRSLLRRGRRAQRVLGLSLVKITQY
jgi:hypothetical protein